MQLNGSVKQRLRNNSNMCAVSPGACPKVLSSHWMWAQYKLALPRLSNGAKPQRNGGRGTGMEPRRVGERGLVAGVGVDVSTQSHPLPRPSPPSPRFLAFVHVWEPGAGYTSASETKGPTNFVASLSNVLNRARPVCHSLNLFKLVSRDPWPCFVSVVPQGWFNKPTNEHRLLVICSRVKGESYK